MPPAANTISWRSLLSLRALLVALGLGQAFRHQDRAHARHLRRIDDQHRDPASGARRHGKQGSVDRLFGGLSVRRDRSDPVHLFHDTYGATEVPAEEPQRFHMGEITLGENFAGARLEELVQGSASRRSGYDGAKGRSKMSCRRRLRSRTRRRAYGRCRQRGCDCRDGRNVSADWSPDASSRIAPASTTSASSSARRKWSACRWPIAAADRISRPSAACAAL